MLLQIAWKNIWRNKTRSLLVMGSVVIGLWVGAFVMAYTFGIMDQRLKDAVETEVSHFQIHDSEFNVDSEPQYVLPNGSQLLEDVISDPRTKSATARVVTFGMAASANTSTGGKFMGIIPENEDAVSGLKSRLTQGEYFADDSRNKAIISERLAEKLNVKLRSKIVLTFQDTTGSIAAGAFRIIGLYRTYNTSFDDLNIFLRAEDLSRLLGTPGQYHEIASLVEQPETLDAFTDELSSANPVLLVEQWKDLVPELGMMVDSFDQYMVIFLIIILLALSFGIVNTMLMAVLERVREIGMLMAIGMNRARLFGMIALETCLLVLIACPIGLLLAYLTISYLNETGMDLSGMYQEGHASYGFRSFIYPKLENVYYLRILIMVVITAVLASIYPAITAIRLNPVTAIRKI